MKLHRNTSPWARKRITPKDDATIRLAMPEEFTAEFVYGGGWACRVRDGSKLVGESYHMASIGGALTEALKDMHAKEAAA